ncbi:hypothetical protein J6590_080168 [Homalodisca vitripennis]|nr:hypothetical protein J6590_080168 [Homalodisca vitripennis]
MAPRRAVKRNAVVHRERVDSVGTVDSCGSTGVSVRAGGVVSVPLAISTPRSGGCVTFRRVERLSPYTQKEAYYSN